MFFLPRISVFLLMCIATIILNTAACDQPPSEHSFSFETMGTEASCQLLLPSGVSPYEVEAIVKSAFSQVNTALSTWIPDSEISNLNRAPADSSVTLSAMLLSCLLVSRELQENSQGAFDPTAESLMRLWGFYRRQGILPSTSELDSVLADLGHWHLVGNSGQLVKDKPGTRFDLGGIAKGLAVDMATTKLRDAGVRHGLIDLGGNLFCLGGAPGRKDWRVGIRNPLNRDELFATVTISDESVATSGSYERFVMIDGVRYGHIMNPATGRPAEGMYSATVIASEGILADGLSTTLFVLGPEKAWPFLREYYPQVEAILVIPGPEGKNDIVKVTPGLKGHIKLISGFEDQYQLTYCN